MKQRRLEFILEARQPISHQEGTFGNVGVIMRQKVRQPSGRWARVPIITGDAMRHQLREAGSFCVLECAGLLQDSLSEAALRLLFSGGMVTGSSGSTVKLDEFREMIKLVPPLGLLGGCVQNRIVPGRIQCDPALLICEETRHLLPDWVFEHVGEAVDTARAHVEEVQRVRMDPTLNPAKRLLLTPGERDKAEGRLLASEAAGESGDVIAADKEKCSMMPFSYERVAQGSLFHWSITCTIYSELDEDTLMVMVGAFLRNARVGGKQGTGHGHIVPLAAKNVSLANFSERMDTLEMVGPDNAIGNLFRSTVADNKERVKEFLAGVVA